MRSALKHCGFYFEGGINDWRICKDGYRVAKASRKSIFDKPSVEIYPFGIYKYGNPNPFADERLLKICIAPYALKIVD